MRFGSIERREVVTLLGVAAAWPFAALAQYGERTRRIGVLMILAEDDPEGRTRIAAFTRGLQALGWVERHTSASTLDGPLATPEIRRDAAELVALTPDVILSQSTPALAALQKATRKFRSYLYLCPIRFGDGFVVTLAKPAGNMTGFSGLRTDYGREVVGTYQTGRTPGRANCRPVQSEHRTLIDIHAPD